MLQGLYYWLRYPQFLRHPRGLALFADLCLASCLRKYAAVKKRFATRIQAVKERAKALRAERQALDPASVASFESTLRNARQLRFEQVLWTMLVGGEAALTYFATLVFLPGRGGLLGFARALIALVATGVAVVVAEKFIDDFLAPADAKTTLGAAAARRRVWMWGILLVGLECALWGLASIRASDMEGASHTPLLYLGMILLSVLLAPAAGGVRHDLMNRVGPVRRAMRLRYVDAALESCAKQLHATRHHMESEWEAMCQGFYNRFADFLGYKEIRNARRGVSEVTAGTYYHTRSDFCTHARVERDAMYDEADLVSDKATSIVLPHGDDPKVSPVRITHRFHAGRSKRNSAQR